MTRTVLSLSAVLLASIGSVLAHPGHDHETTVHQKNDFFGGVIEQGGVLLLVAIGVATAAWWIRKRRARTR